MVQSSSENPGYGAVSSSREDEDEEYDGANSNKNESTIEIGSDAGILQQIQIRLDPTEWLRGGADEDGRSTAEGGGALVDVRADGRQGVVDGIGE